MSINSHQDSSIFWWGIAFTNSSHKFCKFSTSTISFRGVSSLALGSSHHVVACLLEARSYLYSMDERLDSKSYLYSDFCKISPLLSKLKFSITFMREKYVISKCWYLANSAGYEEMCLGSKLSRSWYVHVFSICNPLLCVLKNKKFNVFRSQKRLLLHRISNGCYFFVMDFELQKE